MKRVFISYSRTDQSFARQLTRALEDVGADVWIDFDDIPAGAKWSTAIQDGLDSSDGMLVIISPEAMLSPNVEDEWQYFMDHGNPVIPILYRPAKVHFQLHRLQHIDFSTRRFGDAFAALLDELEAKGVPLKFEEAEETVKFVNPQKAATSSESPKTVKTNKTKEKMSTFPLLPVAVLGGLVLIVLAAFLIWNVLPKASDDSDISAFDDIPPALVIESNGWDVHVNVHGNDLYSFDNTLLHKRFFDNDLLWYEIEDVDKGLSGYQTPDLIPTDQPELLEIVPLLVTLSYEELALYKEPYYEAQSLNLVSDLDIKVHGFHFDDDDQLWYYVTVFSVDHNDIITGWMEDTDNLPHIVESSQWMLPVMAYTNEDVDARWHYDTEDFATTIPEATLVYILYEADDFYAIAYYLDDDRWQVLFIPQSEVDISDTAREYVE